MATILIVDDLLANRRLLVSLLQQQGHRMVEAADGSQALALVRAERPDLVITDVLMPVMDGYEFVRQLRLDPATRATPVVFFTAHYGEDEARELALSSGVAHVLTKPVDASRVRHIVNDVLAGASNPAMRSATVLPPAFERAHLRLLTDKLSENTLELKRANARLRALINIGLELASEHDAGHLLQSVCIAACDLFGASYATLGIVEEEDAGTIERVVTHGVDAPAGYLRGDPVARLLMSVIRHRRTVRGQLEAEGQRAPAFGERHPHVEAFLAAPIASPSRVYGWICLVGNEGRSFAEDDEPLLTALSGQVGRIYENDHLYDVARKRAGALEREMLERQQAVEALSVAEERMRFALEAAGVGIWDLDCATGLMRWSEIFATHYGLPPGSPGGSFDALVERIHPDDRTSVLQTIDQAMSSGADFWVENRAVWPGGTVRWLSGAGRIHRGDRGQPGRGVGISLDVTDRRTLEEQYQQSQKMEAIGRLAGGVAHDLNNLLTVILGYCGLLLTDLKSEDARRKEVSAIQSAGVSASGLTRLLLALSRTQIVEPTLLNLNDVVATVLVILRRLIADDIAIVLNLAPDLARTKGDRGQMEQVVMNLAINARDAMPGGGTLTIDTANIEVEAAGPNHRGVKPGSYVALTVSDTGSGMEPGVWARLFEPFFTTKEPGKGTGLGLTTVDSIVSHGGGHVTVETELGRGSSFRVYVPRAEASGPVAEPPAEPVAAARLKRVLIVEDSDGIRELARRILERQGYTVLTAANASEALQQFEQHPSIDLLLTDVVMPGASGPELTRQLLQQRPLLKVVYMSGCVTSDLVEQSAMDTGGAVLNKPFTAEALARRVREALERRVAPNP